MYPFATPLMTLVLAAAAGPQGKYFAVTVVDDQTGRGVPLVELETVNHIRYYTDSNGTVAFLEPGLMDQAVFFHVRSHGYEFPKDGFGFRGKAIPVRPGGSTKIAIKRLNIAERLYRVTGGGIYRDTLLVGKAAPTRQPVLNGQVFGSDSVMNALYRGKLYWFWGDTNRPSYPLGNFHMTGATSALPADGGLDPEVGVNLHYFVDDQGFARPMAKVPGPGPTWISGLVTLAEKPGRERMLAGYAKIRKEMEVYERGLVEFDDDQGQFVKVTAFDLRTPLYPDGHPFHRVVAGTEYIYFATPYPLVRVRADVRHVRDLSKYEAFTCLKAGSRLDRLQIDRAADGTPRYGWKRDTPALGPREQARLIAAGRLKSSDVLLSLQDADTGRAVTAHSGSVSWNGYRGRWVMIALEIFGTSALGEVWYAEADTPLGPWVYARKVVTHDRYSFYNPKQHPLFDRHGGRVIFFEGTYASTFSGNPEPTPRYDYNQVMYKLDLADRRLVLPVPIYALSGARVPSRFGTVRELGPKDPRQAAFFALDRPGEGALPVYAVATAGGGRALQRDRPPPATSGRKPLPLFYALPADTKSRTAVLVPLYEFISADGKQHVYSTDRSWSKAGYERSKQPLCLVWRNPVKVAIPDE